MAKCALCKKTIEKTFLGKIKGTYYRKKPICDECQKKFPKAEDILKKI
jgi:hypothetical protein